MIDREKFHEVLRLARALADEDTATLAGMARHLPGTDLAQGVRQRAVLAGLPRPALAPLRACLDSLDPADLVTVCAIWIAGWRGWSLSDARASLAAWPTREEKTERFLQALNLADHLAKGALYLYHPTEE